MYAILHPLALPQAVAALPVLPSAVVAIEVWTLFSPGSEAAFTEIVLIVAWYESPSDVGSSIRMVVAPLHC